MPASASRFPIASGSAIASTASTGTGARRHGAQAVYTNLAPGPYRLPRHRLEQRRRVERRRSGGPIRNAAEHSGRRRGSRCPWFSCAALAGWGAYRLRVFQVARQLNMRFEERLAERTRIAQELHDTLLQGFVSASMQLHVAADRLPDDSPAKPSLTRVLELMGRSSTKGATPCADCASAGARRTISSRRSRACRGARRRRSAPIPRHRRGAGPAAESADPRRGLPDRPRRRWSTRSATPAAGNVEVELEYGAGDLRMLVRDDGRGIDARGAAVGSDGHWGLTGHARARRAHRRRVQGAQPRRGRHRSRADGARAVAFDRGQLVPASGYEPLRRAARHRRDRTEQIS